MNWYSSNELSFIYILSFFMYNSFGGLMELSLEFNYNQASVKHSFQKLIIRTFVIKENINGTMNFMAFEFYKIFWAINFPIVIKWGWLLLWNKLSIGLYYKISWRISNKSNNYNIYVIKLMFWGKPDKAITYGLFKKLQ